MVAVMLRFRERKPLHHQSSLPLLHKSHKTNSIKAHFQRNGEASHRITRQLQICRLNNPNLATTTFSLESANATVAVAAAMKLLSFRNVGGQRLFVTHLSTPIINSLHFFIFHGRDPPPFVNFGWARGRRT